MATRYIGSKARVVDDIMEILGRPTDSTSHFVDAFAGTGVVASAAADLGWAVTINDTLRSSRVAAQARLLSRHDVSFAAHGGYMRTLAALNDVTPRGGFVTREYSAGGPDGRMYFTEENARLIDAVRSKIGHWTRDGLLSDLERDLLLADLIAASNRVANIAGTYGCFLSHWSGAARKPLRLTPRKLRTSRVDFSAVEGDASDVPISSTDIAYLDPPYTKRQYAAYYHIPETIVYGDEPDVGGKTGLRPWKHLASRFCYSRKAHTALVDLVTSLPARVVYLSYGNEGHVDLDELSDDLGRAGYVHVHPLARIGRYRPNQPAVDNGGSVSEFIVEFTAAEQRMETAA